jgi:PAS domain S-box-containing protein
MSEEESNIVTKSNTAWRWRPAYVIYLSVLAAFIVTLVMLSSQIQYLRIMRAIDTSRPSSIDLGLGYSSFILIGFVNLLIILGGVLLFTIQRKRKYTEELDELLKKIQDSKIEFDAVQDRYRLITENVTDVILTTDLQGRITFITPSIEAYLGIKYTEMLGKKIENYITKRSVRVLSKDIIFRRQNPEKFKEVTTNEIELEGKDDHSVWAELKTIGYSEKGQQRGYLGVFRDITLRKKSERGLKFQSDVLYNITDEVDMVDLDGKILYVNKAVLNDLHIQKEDIIGKTKTILLPDPEYNISKTDIIKWVKEKGHWEGIVGNYLPDGRRRVVSTRSKLLYDENNVPRGIMSISTNITKKIEMQKELKQSESKYSLLIANVSDVIWTSDKEFNLNFITKSVEKFLGYTPDQLISLKKREYFSPDSLEKIQKIRTRFKNNFTNVNFPIVFNAELICSDRTRKWAEAKINPLIDEDGIFSGFVGVWRDITSFIITNERNKSLEDRLAQSEKMEALGRLAGGVAHDLNNVLTGIVAYPDILLLKLPEDNPMRKKVLAIKKSGQKAAAIVEDLLSLSRRGVNKFIPLDMNSLIKDILDSPEVEKLKVYHPEIKFKFSAGKDVPPISGAEYQISKVIINLFTNACEAMPSGGNIYISTAYESSSKGPLRYKNIPDGDYAVLTFTDEGIGISAEDQKKIYEPFFTNKVMGRSGTGLGMAVVWGTIQDHNGYIELNSRIGEGTTFEIFLPALSESAAFESEISEQTSLKGKGEKILILDDEQIQLEIADSLFTELNYIVRTVSEPAKIIKEINDFKPDLLILDMILGESLDGLDVYKNILSHGINVNTIIVSGFSESERVIEAISLGVKRYIKKPFTIDEIGRCIREILDKNE